MAATRKRDGKGELLNRLQALLYEYHALGRFAEAKPHILWLMEIAQAERESR
ncbi:MAG: hypothetical protein WDN03_01795 [Rhizomicrobium sp.]